MWRLRFRWALAIALTGVLAGGCTTPAVPTVPAHTLPSPLPATVVATQTTQPRPATAAPVHPEGVELETATTRPLPSTSVSRPTAAPTRPAPGGGDPLWADLIAKGYRVLFNGEFEFAGNTYAAFGFIDQALEPTWTRASLTAESCRLGFYRMTGAGDVLIQAFPAPEFPPSSRYAGPPFDCVLMNWDTPNRLFDPTIFDPSVRQALNLSGYMSDINANGLPEFAVVGWYCPNACDGNETQLHLYEVRDESTVVALTDGLPGAVMPWSLARLVDPGTLWVQDVGLEYEPHVEIDAFWIFRWAGDGYQDVSHDYARTYATLAQPFVDELEGGQGQPFGRQPASELALLSILYLYEKGGLAEEGLARVQEVARLDNWPDSDPVARCWLQLIPALAARDLEQGTRLRLMPSMTYVDAHLEPGQDLVGQLGLDLQGAGLSQCQPSP